MSEFRKINVPTLKLLIACDGKNSDIGEISQVMVVAKVQRIMSQVCSKSTAKLVGHPAARESTGGKINASFELMYVRKSEIKK